MIQLVYISTSRARVIDDALLESILAASRRNNEARGISGLLLAGGRRFLQALEGPRQAVEATYARIKGDPRHFAFVELANRSIVRPEFGAWAMAYTQAGTAEAGAALRDAVQRLTADLPDRDVRALFTGFAELHCPSPISKAA